jgi:hypothetical protein
MDSGTDWTARVVAVVPGAALTVVSGVRTASGVEIQ